jgi:hypothetical protein
VRDIRLGGRECPNIDYAGIGVYEVYVFGAYDVDNSLGLL